MDQDILLAANRAAITSLPSILGIRAEHETNLAATMDRMTTDLLQAVFRLGFEAGVKSGEPRK